MNFFEGQRVEIRKCFYGRPDCNCVGTVGYLKLNEPDYVGKWLLKYDTGIMHVDDEHIEPHFLPGDKVRLVRFVRAVVPPGTLTHAALYELNPANKYTVEGIEDKCVYLCWAEPDDDMVTFHHICVTLDSIEALPPKITPADIDKAIKEVRAEKLATEAEPVEFKSAFRAGDRVKTDTGRRGTLVEWCGSTGWRVNQDDCMVGFWYDDQLTLLPEAKAPVKEDSNGIASVFLPGTVESLNPSDYWYYVGVKTTRGTVTFPITHEHAKDICIGQEYAISLRKG